MMKTIKKAYCKGIVWNTNSIQNVYSVESREAEERGGADLFEITRNGKYKSSPVRRVEIQKR